MQRIAPAAPPTGEGWPDDWPRPARLLPTPEPIEAIALLPDHPPVSFTWRGIRRRVKRADGPERVFGEWWKCDSELIAVRDYFQVEDESCERFWDLPRRRRRRCCYRLAPLVPAWNLRMSDVRYAELQCTSHFSFLRGASSCEELFAQAAMLGIEALAGRSQQLRRHRPRP